MPKEEVVRLRREGGRWLRVQRERAGLSQKQLADMLGADYYSFVSQIESGKGRVPVTKMEIWAQALRLSPHDFAKGILRFYDPLTYKMLFSEEVLLSPPGLPLAQQDCEADFSRNIAKTTSNGHSLTTGPHQADAPNADLLARLSRLEALLMLKGVGP